MKAKYPGYEGVTPMKLASIYGYTIDAVEEEMKNLKKVK
jgi:hypothetical protein